MNRVNWKSRSADFSFVTESERPGQMSRRSRPLESQERDTISTPELSDASQKFRDACYS